jgi:hypothetical protein
MAWPSSKPMLMSFESGILINVIPKAGRAIAQAVSRRLPTAVARVLLDAGRKIIHIKMGF